MDNILSTVPDGALPEINNPAYILLKVIADGVTRLCPDACYPPKIQI